jgi:hypothetical protein
MKRLFIALFAFLPLLFISCEKEDTLTGYTYQSESTIFNQSNQVQFREVLFTIKPYIMAGGVKKFIVTDTLLNVKVKMNNTLWSTTKSLALDTSGVQKQTLGLFQVSDYNLKYSVIANYQPEKTVLTTAGEYSDLLRAYMNIEPGVYFCQVESFEIRLADGSRRKTVPLISEMVEITANTRSLFLGEFEVEIF